MDGNQFNALQLCIAYLSIFLLTKQLKFDSRLLSKKGWKFTQITKRKSLA